MVSRQEDSINFDKLEAELNAAVDADERYQRENDAKFRAVHQKVATYEEFRDIVLASHIKPLEKDDHLKSEEFKQQWNIQASTFKSDTSKSDAEQGDVFTKKHSTQGVPKNGHEFTKEWRRNFKTSADKYQRLIHLGAENLAKIFKAEVGFGLLGEFFQVLNENFRSSDSIEILNILEQLPTTNRFELNLQFLSSKEKNTCQELIQKIGQQLEAISKERSLSEEINTRHKALLDTVKSVYGIDPS